MRNKRFLISSFLVSVLLHLMLLFSSFYVQVSMGQAAIAEQTHHFFKVKSPKVDDMPEQRMSLAPDLIKELKNAQPVQKTTQFVSSQLENSAQLTALKHLSDHEVKEVKLEKSGSKPAPVKAEAIDKEKFQVPRKVVSTHAREIDLSIFKTAENADEILREEISEDLAEEFFEEMPAFTPRAAAEPGGIPAGLSGGMGSMSASVPGMEAMLKDLQDSGYESLENFLSVSLSAYRDPQDGKGYWKMMISPNPSSAELEVTTKEVIYLLDASRSIQDRRLAAFSRGITDSIAGLNPGDYFNVYVFKEKIYSLFPESVPANVQGARQAQDFLSKIEPSLATNFYLAFSETMRARPKILPSYVMLFSDGKPNRGTRSSAELIGDITRENQHIRSFFAFSAGHFVNRFLLDFLAYPNKGWAEYAREIDNIPVKINELHEKIRYPILLDTEYAVSGVSPEKVYPRKLPDFFRGARFVIYGTFDQEKDFFIRIKGQINGKIKAVLFKGDLTQAAPGEAEIARDWALNRVYHLISKVTLGEGQPEDLLEIEALIKKYDFKIPYKYRDIVGKKWF